jgi:hypothetical protein
MADAAAGSDNETDEHDNDDLGEHRQSPIADHLLLSPYIFNCR